MTNRLRTSQLESWAASLGFLADEVIPGIERMAQRLAIVMTDESPSSVGADEPNGYGGIARHGELGRLLLSDWALAQAEPTEFLRRFTTGELSYLELEFQAPRPPSQIAVLLDSGPDQLGARRLIQLAGLVVLARRAHVLGVPLVVSILGDDPPTWHTGELAELHLIWLRSRRPVRADLSAIKKGLSDLPDDASIWLFGATDFRSKEIEQDVRCLSAIESSWDADGATELDVIVDNRTLTLALPSQSACLQVLRGHGLRRRMPTLLTGDRHTLRFPSFHGSTRRLLGRGEGDDELVMVNLPQAADGRIGRPKRRRFPGPVLAASLIGTRTVAMVAQEGAIRVVVVGKRLGRVNTIDLTPAELGLEYHGVDHLTESGLEPLYFASGSIVVRLGQRWWSIEPPGFAAPVDYILGAASPVADQPRFVRRVGSSLTVDGRSIHTPGLDNRVLLGPRRTVALETMPGIWNLSGSHTGHIEVDPRATICGLSEIAGEPALVVQSAAGHILRLARRTGVTTLTQLSHEIASTELHPTLPLAAITRLDGTVDVVDLEAKELAVRVRAGLS